MNKIYLYIVILTYLSIIHAANTDQSETPKHIKLVRSPKNAHNYQGFLVGAYNHFRGDHKAALHHFQHCLSYSPSAYAHSGYFHLLQTLGKPQEIIAHYENNHELHNKLYHDVAAQITIAQAYMATGNTDKAESMFVRLGDLHPENEQIAYFATMALLKNNQLEKADKFIATCLKTPTLKPKHFLFHFLQSKIHFQKQNLEGALDSIEKSLALSPKFPQALLFKAMVMEQRNDIGNAIKGYEGFVHATKSDVSVEKHIIQLLFNKGEYNKAIKRLEKLNGKTPDYFYDLGLMHFHNKNYNKALSLVEQTLSSEPTLMNAILLKIKVLAALEKTSDLAPFAQKLLIQQPNNVQILQTYLLLKNMGVSTRTLIEVGCAALKVQKTARLIATVADLCVEAKEVGLAEKMYGSIIKHSKNAQVRARARYQTCYALFAANQEEALEKRLLEVLADQVIDPAVYNLAAYYFATHDKQLEQALSYVDKALAQRPDYPPYLDTKAYVLVKMGKKDDGLALLRDAQKKSPQDRIIAARILSLEGGLWKS
ncbi:hypothetical protein FJ365_02080 [Candidatus Dependentiae bacterium]|nr:hypothetical protein [Candidatus Dependentiae bacterium]